MTLTTRTAAGALFLTPFIAFGCATVDPELDYARARKLIGEATGKAHVYSPGEDELVAERVSGLLEGGISADEAVEIALLNNRDLQAAFFEIGVARADVVQAGLLSNPSLSALVRFPTSGGSSSVEAELAWNLIELWRIPARKGVARDRLHRTVLQLSHDAAVLAADARAAYYSAITSERALAVEEENLGTVRELLDLTLARQQAGDATELDVNVVRAQLLDQEVVTRAARLSVFEARRVLATVLGFDTPPEDLELADELSDVAIPDVSLERILELTRTHRLDLQAARHVVGAARENVRLQKRLFLRTIAPGAALESEGSDLAVGPAVDLELPIFDQNQARIARAEFRHEQALRVLEAMTLAAVQETRGAYERFLAARDIARTYTERLLPLGRQNLELARESFQAGKTSFLSVLEVERSFLETRRQYTERLRALAVTLPDLERATGRPLSTIFEQPEEPQRDGAAREGQRSTDGTTR